MKKQLIAIASVAMLAGVFTFSSCKKSDTTAPVITITGGTSQNFSLNATYANPAATATDDVDGDVTSKITISNPTVVNNNLKGAYVLHYSVSDAAGNTATQDVTINIVNDAEWLAGGYAVVDSVYNTSPVQPGLPFVNPYSETITTDNAVNNKIWVAAFGDYTGGAVYMTVTGTGTGAGINIPIQNVTCGSPSAVHTFSNDTQNPAATVTVVGTRPYFMLYYLDQVAASSSTAHSEDRYYHN